MKMAPCRPNRSLPLPPFVFRNQISEEEEEEEEEEGLDGHEPRTKQNRIGNRARNNETLSYPLY